MKLLRLYILISFFTTTLLSNYSARANDNVLLLNRLESKFYKGKVFYRDSILKRLQRLEIALFGEFKSKDAPLEQRLRAIENEILVREINKFDQRRKFEKSLKPQWQRGNSQDQSALNLHRLRNNQIRETRSYERSVEEDRRVFSIVNPIIQNLMRTSINAIF